MKFKLLLSAIFLSTEIFAASSFTPNYDLEKPAAGDTGWSDALNSNADTIDEQMSINATSIADHISDTEGAHAATAISTTVGSLVCFDQETVQDYLDCLDAQVGALTAGEVVTTNTVQTITAAKTWTALQTFSGGISAGGTITLSDLSTGLAHFDASGVISSSLLVNADVSASAGIVYSKLSLTDSIVDADINSAAAIAYSKLNLASSIQDSDINTALSYSVLDLTDSIVNADINSAAAIAYSKLNLAGSVDLTSDVTGTLTIANGGTGSATQNFVDLTTTQSIAGLKTFTEDVAFTENTAAFSTGTYNSTDKTITRFTSGTGTLQAITSENGSLQVLINDSGAELTVENNANLVTGTENDVQWKAGATLFFVKDNSKSYLIGGVGGGSTASDVFTGTTLTATADASQKWRYEGTSPQTLATLDFSAAPDGARIVITSSASGTNALTIPTTLTDVVMNGEKTLIQYGSIEYIKDGTKLIQVGI